jgi:formate dehydrogenase maturation protein FdhE
MIKFGILKSKIEKVLLESYSNNTFKDELKNFKKLVLENKNISKIFYLYDELSSKKGLNENTVNDYIHECITMYENSINKIKSSDLNNLKSWVNNVKSKNLYETVDGLFSTDVLTIESKIKSKKLIKESLMSVAPINKEVIQLPLTTMVNVANKTITAYIDDLNESEKKDLMKFLSTDDSVLKESFETIKGDVIAKLKTLQEGSDIGTLNRITETIEKVESEKYDKLSYFKLKNLKETL